MTALPSAPSSDWVMEAAAGEGLEQAHGPVEGLYFYVSLEDKNTPRRLTDRERSGKSCCT